MPLDNATSEFLTLTTTRGLLRPCVLVFGPKQGPAIMQQLLDTALETDQEGQLPLRDEGGELIACAFIDDLHIGAQDYIGNMSDDEIIALHEEHCIRAAERLERYRIQFKLEKCSFSQKMVKLLGVLCGQNQKVPEKKKVDMLKNWPFPSTLDDLASFRAFAA